MGEIVQFDSYRRARIDADYRNRLAIIDHDVRQAPEGSVESVLGIALSEALYMWPSAPVHDLWKTILNLEALMGEERTRIGFATVYNETAREFAYCNAATTQTLGEIPFETDLIPCIDNVSERVAEVLDTYPTPCAEILTVPLAIMSNLSRTGMTHYRITRAPTSVHVLFVREINGHVVLYADFVIGIAALMSLESDLSGYRF